MATYYMLWQVESSAYPRSIIHYFCKLIRGCIKFTIRCCFLFRGGERLARMPLPRKLTLKRELAVTRLRGGGKLVVRLNDGCGRTIYYWGDYDRKITWICRRLLRPGDCFLDFGANFGEVGMFAAKFVGPTGEVHIVEPQPELARFIKFSAELNGFSHVHVHEIGLSTEDGEFQLNVPTGNSGAASFDPQLASEFAKKSWPDRKFD